MFCKLPLEHAIDSDFHDVCLHPLLRPTVRPSHHWVFLGEIFIDMSLFRPSYAVKDRAGDQLPVHFHHDDPMEELVYKFDAARYVVGSTIAMFYAENHAFMDETHGIRVESLASIKVRVAALCGDGEARVWCSVDKGDVAHPLLSRGVVVRRPRRGRRAGRLCSVSQEKLGRSGPHDVAVLSVQDQILQQGMLLSTNTSPL